MCNDNIQPLRGWVLLMLLYPWISSRAIQILALRAIANFYFSTVLTTNAYKQGNND